jgi:hypothetical protein
MAIYKLYNADGSFVNSIVAEEDVIESFKKKYMVTEYVPDDTPGEPLPPVPEVRRITVGSFFDRFGALKYPILASSDLGVQAVIKDASVRSFIDLDDEQLMTGLNLIVQAGFELDPEQLVSGQIQAHERA